MKLYSNNKNEVYTKVYDKVILYIQGIANYNNESVTIIGSHKDKLLIISSHNPIQSEWVLYTELSNVTWIVSDQVA